MQISFVKMRTKNEIRVFCSDFVFGKQNGKRDGSVHTRIPIKESLTRNEGKFDENTKNKNEIRESSVISRFKP